jgi:hypothetical protein
MESIFSNQLDALMPNGAPAAPSIRKVEFVNREARVVVRIPTNDADGGPLTGLTNCTVFVKESTFDGSTPEQERALNTLFVTMPIEDLNGGEVTIYVPNLKYDVKYYFAASCSD